jgi:alpha-tubulin suppressor-like RCC1 family protein
VDLGAGKKAIAIASGDAHTCALLDDGGVKCWGVNDEGSLGVGDDSPHGSGKNEMGDSLPAVTLGLGAEAVAIDAGGSHACALLSDGDLKCWGLNDRGQLGLGDEQSRGDDASEMGDNLPVVVP